VAKQESDITPQELQQFLDDYEINASELARRLGTTRGAPCRWLSGNRTPPPYLRRALDSIAEELMTERG
jgi:DNA-binding transcriptional regulator YiaG